MKKTATKGKNKAKPANEPKPPVNKPKKNKTKKQKLPSNVKLNNVKLNNVKLPNNVTQKARSPQTNAISPNNFEEAYRAMGVGMTRAQFKKML